MSKGDWLSERMIFGLLIIVGYFTMGALAILVPGLAAEQRAIARDVLLAVGPLIGMIVQSIWKTDKADKVAADTAAVLAAKAPDLSGSAPLQVKP